MIVQFPKKAPREGEIFDFYADPSHGWLHVPWTVFRDNNINPFIFSNHSYADELGAYLEEDVDLGVFEKLFVSKTGKRITFHDIADDVGLVRSKQSLTKFLVQWSQRKGEEGWK